MPHPFRFVSFSLCCLALSHPAFAQADEKPSFDRDIRPILSENCFRCHGPDENTRQADLRLDTSEGASGVIAPGRLDQSELWRRVTSADDDERMPPPASGKKLTASDLASLRAWIDEGAEYESHWSFRPPVKKPPPDQRERGWARTPIDSFARTRLDREGLSPRPEADRHTLIRRLSLDLTGLPPSPDEVRAFVADTRPDAFERLVDRLLASPHFGECFALEWLDAARYADTNGYFVDNERHMWRWRDWVIAAFNQNMPFDQFTVEQLAGDLLPQATLEQQIASGFHRNHPVTYETGIIDEEYRVEYVCDRVDTTAAVWLGLTLGCARCHDHKYDPVSQRDFYRLFAFFNNLPEKGNTGRDGNADPQIPAPLPEQTRRLAELEAALAQRERAIESRGEEIAAAQTAWLAKAAETLPAITPALISVACEANEPTALPRGKVGFAAGIAGQAVSLDGDSWLEFDAPLMPERDRPFAVAAWFRASAPQGSVLCRFDDRDGLRGFNVMIEKSMLVVQLMHRNEGESILLTSRPLPLNRWRHVAVSYDGGGHARGVTVYLDGRPLEMKTVYDTLDGPIAVERPWRLGRRSEGYGLKGLIDEARLYDRTLTAGEVDDLFTAQRLEYLLDTPAEKRTPAQTEELRDFFIKRSAGEPLRGDYLRLLDARRELADFRATVPTAMVMRELDQPRETFVLARGQYDQPRERVAPGVPAALPPLPTGIKPDRLALARWLVDRGHPLTARVIVNRFWYHFFGQGLVGTLNDFGSQGEPPTHPDLLDWLAVDFIESGWNIKALARLMVTSAAYRQSSDAPPDLIARDPDNRLLARGPRYRLPAELVRDQALAASSLLVRTVGGPSVKPYQPAGLWEAVSYGGEQSYEQDHGAGLYRRGMYTFWKRQAPPPALLAFDAPTRETCVVRRSRTNTPLQALVLLNDATYVEAAREIATRVLKSCCRSDEERLRLMCMLVVCRQPDAAEHAELAGLLGRQLAHYRAHLPQAEALLSVGESAVDHDLSAADLAAWTLVAHSLLNLDEVLCKN